MLSSFIRTSLGLSALFVGIVVALSGGCGGGGDSAPVVTTFTHSPLDLSDFEFIQPMGNLNPPGHTFPTDHIYFYFPNPPGIYPVYAPADGTITGIINRSQAGPPVSYDHKIDISHGGTLHSYLDHVGQLAPEILAQTGTLPDGYKAVSVPVTAGQRIGNTTGRPGAMDLGTYDTATTVAGLIHPDHYYDQTTHCTAPLSYYTGELRTSLYGMVRRTGADKDGRIGFDEAGKLVGNWFSQGATSADWTRHLAFVYDPNEPSEVRISMGGELGMTGVYKIPAMATDPRDVGTGNGKVAYRLLEGGGTQAGLLIAQVTGAETIKVEVFAGSAAADADFTAAARTYVR